MQIKDQTVMGVVLSDTRDKVLLIQRRDVPVWTLVGGGIEKDESLENAIIRELCEETGYTTKVIKKIGEYTPVNKLTKYTHLYECKILSGEPTLSDETRKINFFDINNLPKLLPPPYPEWIHDGLKNEKTLIKRNLKSVNYYTLIKNLFLHPILVVRFLLTKIGLTINS
ncbi:MAG: RNA pyrophosphohydrolase [Candidatus Anoxychlamydiales bacterium]|nr:RNA pyrophosphohydrolase [Candidatus Anoxychlamydiales bacterium]